MAAPVFSNVMSGALRVLDVPPDNPTGNVVLPPVSEPSGRGVDVSAARDAQQRIAADILVGLDVAGRDAALRLTADSRHSHTG